MAFGYAMMRGGLRCTGVPPLTITLTRIGGKRMDDDNCAGGFKNIRDCVAGWLGIDDGDTRLTWRYEQHPGSGPQSVRVRIESA